MMREEIRKLAEMGPLPASDNAGEEELQTYENLLKAVGAPVSDEEARTLARLFGPDDCYGLAWTLMHLIETAPGWPLKDTLENTTTEWSQRLRLRAERGGRL